MESDSGIWKGLQTGLSCRFCPNKTHDRGELAEPPNPLTKYSRGLTRKPPDVAPALISTVTGPVREEIRNWQGRRLEAIAPMYWTRYMPRMRDNRQVQNHSYTWRWASIWKAGTYLFRLLPARNCRPVFAIKIQPRDFHQEAKVAYSSLASKNAEHPSWAPGRIERISNLDSTGF